MRKFSLLALCLVFLQLNIFAQLSYSNTSSLPHVYNPGFNNQGVPRILFDDANLPASQISGADSISIIKVNYGIYRHPFAPPITIKFYYMPVNPATTNSNNLPLSPPVQFGSVNLGTYNSPVGDNVIVSLGDSVNPLFKIKTDPERAYAGQQTVFLGLSFSQSPTSPTSAWRFVTGTQSFNANDFWIYDIDSAVQMYSQNFGADPAPRSSLYLQVYGKGANILPIRLGDFRAERNGSKVDVSWATISEQNNSGFELQRSADGNNFSSLAQISSKAANGTSSTPNNYVYEDLKPFVGRGYYRLKQIDRDGKITYSKVVSVSGLRVSSPQFSSLYPNPSKGVLNLVLTAPAADNIDLVISDLSGRIVMTKKSQIVPGDNKISFDITKLAAGGYIVKAICDNGCESVVSNFMKQ